MGDPSGAVAARLGSASGVGIEDCNAPSGNVAGGEEPVPVPGGGGEEPSAACGTTKARIFAVEGVSAGGATAGIGAVNEDTC